MPIKQNMHKMNPNYMAKVNEKVYELLKAKYIYIYIYVVDRAERLSCIVIVPKKKWEVKSMCGFLET